MEEFRTELLYLPEPYMVSNAKLEVIAFLNLDISLIKEMFKNSNYQKIYLQSYHKLKNDFVKIFEVYFKLNKNIDHLNLSGQFLSDFPNLQGYNNLHTLDLSNNNLTEIPNFTGMNNLLTLELAHNLLESIPNFENLTMLRLLDCSNNFFRVVPILTLPSLMFLILDYNELTTLSNLDRMPMLSIVSAKNNLMQRDFIFANNIKIYT